MLSRKEVRRRRYSKRNRCLLLEQLEDRRLLFADWQNPDQPLDVSGDGHVVARDALLLVNALNRAVLDDSHGYDLPIHPVFGSQQPPYYDVSGDGRLSPADLQLVISALNVHARSALLATEGEGTIVPNAAPTCPPGSGWTVLAGIAGAAQDDCAPSTPVSDWTFHESGGSSVRRGTAVLEDSHVVLREGDSFLVGAEQTFVVPDAPATLSFTYFDLSFDTSDSFIRDAFEAALVDDSGHTLVYPMATGRQSYFNITEGQSPALGSQATLAGQTVTLDTSGLTPGSTAHLILRLVNNDSDTLTSVSIQDIQLPGTMDCLPFVAIALEMDTAPPGNAGLPYTTDLLTNNPAIVGLASDDSAIAKLTARVDGGLLVDITSTLIGGQFQFDPGSLAPRPSPHRGHCHRRRQSDEHDVSRLHRQCAAGAQCRRRPDSR